MGPTNAGPSETQPPTLINLIGKGKHKDIQAFWETSTVVWDADRVYEAVQILEYDSNELRLKAKKVQLLNKVARDFEDNSQKPIKTSDTQDRLEHAIWIMKAMCHRHPKIAFEQCLNHRSSDLDDFLPSAFQFAVMAKSEYIFEHYWISFSKPTSLPQQPQQIICNGKKAAEENMVQIVELLLSNSASLPHDVESKVMDIIDIMVGKTPSLLNERTWKDVVTTPLPNFARRLPELRDLSFLTEAHATFVAEEGTVSMWQMFPEQIRRASISAQDFGLLRTTISSKKVDMAKAIFELDATFIDASIEAEGYEYLLQHPKGIKKGSVVEDLKGIFRTIRDLLVGSMILGVQDMRDILRRLETHETSLNFSQFKSDTNNGNFTNYVQGLKTMKTDAFRFEMVLKYVTFPELSNIKPVMGIEDAAKDHREVMDVFEFLTSRGVQQILNLSVKDRLYCPHTDEDVAASVNTFGVRVLKWKKLDIYLRDLDATTIEELYLYSSGNRSVHDQWLSQLPRFQQDVIRPRLISQVSEELERGLNNMYNEQKYNHACESDDEDASERQSSSLKRRPRINISEIFWTKRPDTMDTIGQSLDNKTSNILSSYLTAFVEKFCGYQMEHPGGKRVKVVLIDSGVIIVGGGQSEDPNDDIYCTLQHRIIEGISLVSRDEEEQNWWHATAPHGTQMAAIICSLNPFVDLYVVKVAESDGSGITGHNVAKGIEWARSKGVDVISLSLVTFSDPNNKMLEAIKAARNDDIVITCSIADEGNMSARSVGENNKNVLSIAACDRWGNLIRQSRRTGFDYQFLGHNVHIGRVPYSESNEVIEGSSVSTAIAAGTASLILACARISSPILNHDVYEKDSRRRSWRCDAVKRKFDSMSEGKWVILDNLCGQGELRKYHDFERLVRDSFKN
ncbi:peptidase S8/S53 domain-containing protein [Trichoderma compactum]